MDIWHFDGTFLGCSVSFGNEPMTLNWQSRSQTRSHYYNDCNMCLFDLRHQLLAMLCFLTAVALSGLSVRACNKERVMAAGAPRQAQGTAGEEQTVVSFHWKHMVKLKCVIYLGLRVAPERRAHTHMLTHKYTHRRAHSVTGCNLPGAYGWPSIPLHLSYTETAQTQFTLPGRDGESETNFSGPADRESKKSHGDRDVRAHRTERPRESETTFSVRPQRKTLPQNLPHVGVAAHPVSHPLQFINLAPFQSRRSPPFRERKR